MDAVTNYSAAITSERRMVTWLGIEGGRPSFEAAGLSIEDVWVIDLIVSVSRQLPAPPGVDTIPGG